MRYPFVLFDIGGTLIGPADSYGAVYASVVRKAGMTVSTDVMETAIRRTSAEISREVPPGACRYSWYPGGEQEFWSRFASRSLKLATRREVDPQLVETILGQLRDAFADASAWTVYPDVVPTLRALTADGFRLGVVSNWDSRLPRLLETLRLDSWFDVVGVSCAERIEKPDPRLFERVLERMGARPEQALHVGNVPELDIEGARAADVDALLVDRTGSARDRAGVTAFTEIPRLARDGFDPPSPRT